MDSSRLLLSFCGGGVECTVIFMSNPTSVLRLCCHWGCGNSRNTCWCLLGTQEGGDKQQGEGGGHGGDDDPNEELGDDSCCAGKFLV